MPTKLPDNLREFSDTAKTRQLMNDGVLDAVSKRFPVEDDDYRLELNNVRYDGPKDFGLKAQKNALLKDRRLNTPIRGQWRLTDKKTGDIVDEREDIVMNVPYYSPRGTFIHNGSEYSMINQMRLRPGTYVRKQRTGEIEAHMNVSPGKGKSMRMHLDPESGVFKLVVGKSSVPMYPILKALGVDDKSMIKNWGADLTATNASKRAVNALSNFYERVAGYKVDPALDDNGKAQYLRDTLPNFEMDEDVNARTLGLVGAKGITPELLLRTSQKMLAVSRGEEDPDDRDALQYSKLYGVEDLMRERIDKDAGRLSKNILRKIKRRKNLSPAVRGVLNPYIDSLLLGSGLAMPLEETNPLHTLEQLNRITKLGEGGIGSAEAITDEARDVHPGQLGFIDPITGPEGCYIGNTEVMTKTGWVRIDSVTEDTELACLEEGRITYNSPSEVYELEYSGFMYSADTAVRLCETSDHKCLVRGDEGEYHWQRTSCMFEQDRHVRIGQVKPYISNSVAKEGDRDNSPTYELPVDVRIELLDACCPELKAKHSEGKRCRYRSSTSDLAKDVERLAFGLGYAVKYIEGCDGGAVDIYPDEESLIKASAYSRKQYTGPVYCCTVPGSQMYVRLTGGMGHWSGNLNIGIDVRAAYRTFKGNDNNIYAEFKDRTGNEVYLKPADVVDKVIGYPGQSLKDPEIYAMHKGKIALVNRKAVDYFVPSFGHMMSTNTNLNPMPTAVQAGRQFYGAKFWTQYMPQVKGQVPLVDSLMPDGKETYSEHYGKEVGTLKSPKAGIVSKVSEDGVTITDADGKKHFTELVQNFPFNRMSAISYFPSVEEGDAVNVGDMLAHSNFTDKKTGSLNLGQNLKVAVMPYRGQSYEDANTISESASKRMATERLLGVDLEARHGVQLSRSKFVSAFPRVFTKKQVGTLDPDGIVKPGTTVEKGDPLIVAVGPRMLSSADAQLGNLHKVMRNAFTDKSKVWEYDYPGTVTDIAHTRSGAKVNVKTTPPVAVGDKLCFDPETELLTSDGWKCVTDINLSDNVAVMNPGTAEFKYEPPIATYAYKHAGKMYKLVNSSLDMLVTPNHKLYVQQRGRTEYSLVEPAEVFGKRVRHKKDGKYVGKSPDYVYLPACEIGHRWGTITKKPVAIPTDVFVALLGAWLSEGNLVWDTKSASYGIDVTQIKGEGLLPLQRILDTADIHYNIHGNGTKLRIYGKQWALYFKQFGNAPDKYIPREVFTWNIKQQRILFNWLMWGDGHSKDGRPVCYTTTSTQLADDFQQLCLHVGFAGRVKYNRVPVGTECIIQEDGVERRITCRHAVHDVRVITTKLAPQVNHGHTATQHVQVEEWVDYDDNVYCVEMPNHHIIYMRRNGHAVWCGNSTRYGLKGVVGAIIPDEEMPRDVSTNEPYDMLMNPMTVLSRVAPGQLSEMALGKLAMALGKPVRLPQEPSDQGWAKWAKQQLDENNVSESTDVFDPVSGKTMKNIGDGYVYVPAFHHLAEKKLSGRGEAGGYTADQQPAKGGHTGSKRFCFPADQSISVAGGEEHIGYLVEKKIPAMVVAPNNDGTPGLFRIKDWCVRRGRIEDVVSISVAGVTGQYGTRTRLDSRVLCPTKNHVLYTSAGAEIRAGEVKPGTWLQTWGYEVTDAQRSMLVGSMLGDGGVGTAAHTWHSQYGEMHSVKQVEYHRWKSRILRLLLNNRSDSTWKDEITSDVGVRFSKTGKRKRVCYYTIGRHDIVDQLATMFLVDGKKRITDAVLAAIDERALCVWFLDDGSCGNHSKRKGKLALQGNIATMGFCRADVVLLGKYLSMRGYACTVTANNSIYLPHQTCMKFAELVARYVPAQAIPKSKKWLRKFAALQQLQQPAVTWAANCRWGTVPAYVYAVKPYVHTVLGCSGEINLYDIEVESVHKYCASGIVVSNSSMDVNAALAHGATNVIKDVMTVRGTKNEDFWKALKLGHPLPEPSVPFIYTKFLNSLRAGGINVVEKGDITKILPMQDKDVVKLSKGAINNSAMVDSDFEPMPGGLFDPGKTGGADGNRWTHIDLPEPIPNPVMEEPIRRLLGLTVKQMENVLSGEDDINGKRGGPAIADALSKIDVDERLDYYKNRVRTTRGANRDNAVKIIGYLAAAKDQEMHPKDWMVTKVPVIPPVFRPISRMGDIALSADLNELYRDVIETANSFKELSKDLPESALQSERLNLYKSVAAAYGLGQPITTEGQSKRLKGAIRQVIGDSPKHGMFQSKVISKPVDEVGRAVVSPDPNLDMDQLGIPEDTAWDLYKPFVQRALVRRGYPSIRAAEMIQERMPAANEVLTEVMADRPVMLDRAPTWHKFNLMAFYPHIVRGKTFRVSPLITKGFTMDFDGDQANIHVPVTDKAVSEAKRKMLPSSNLISLTDLRSVRHAPTMEMTYGLYQLTKPPANKRPVIFRNVAEAKAAYREGKIMANDPIEIVG